MSLSSDFSKTMIHSTVAHTDKLEWVSQCCKAHVSGDLTPPWHELKSGGESQVLREGLCEKCNQRANFVRKE